jgi:hypothetical protein
MADHVDRALRRRPDRWDSDIDRVHPRVRAARKRPLRGAGGGAGPRSGETDDPALRAAHGNVVPAFHRCFLKATGAIVHQDTLWSRTRKLQRGTRRIYPRARIYKRRVCYP